MGPMDGFNRLPPAAKAGILGGVGLVGYFFMRSRSQAQSAMMANGYEPFAVASDDSVYAERGGPVPFFLTNLGDLTAALDRIKPTSPSRAGGKDGDKRWGQFYWNTKLSRNRQLRALQHIRINELQRGGLTRQEQAKVSTIRQGIADRSQRIEELEKHKTNWIGKNPPTSPGLDVGGAIT